MNRANPALIGGFILGAVVLIVAGLLIFGSGKFFQDTIRSVAYFEGSLQGLQVGAPVNFRGVKVGTVADIRAGFDKQALAIRLPVFLEFPKQHKSRIAIPGQAPTTSEADLVALIQHGLRAQLQTESLVTGLLFVQLDLYPDASPGQAVTDPKISPWQQFVDPLTGLIEIPTVPTTLQEVSHAVRQALTKLAALPLDQIVTDLAGALQSIQQLVGAPELKDTIKSLHVTMQDTQQLVQNLDKQVERIASSTTTTLGNIGKLATDAQQLVRNLEKQVERVASGATTTLGNFNKLAQHTDSQLPALLASLKETSTATRGTLTGAQDTFVAVQKFLAPNSPVGYELVQTLQELSDTARSLRVLADYLERYPNAVLFGRNETRKK
jgi:paraquat-inducible protein B